MFTSDIKYLKGKKSSIQGDPEGPGSLTWTSKAFEDWTRTMPWKLDTSWVADKKINVFPKLLGLSFSVL